MKLLRILIISVSIGQALDTFAQGSGSLDTLLSLQEKDKSIPELINILSEKSGVPFSYSTSVFPTEHRISIDIINQPLEVILDEMLLGLEIEYRWIAGKLVITKRPKGSTKRYHTISGYVRDTHTGEILIGATIELIGLQKGTATNAYGLYSLTLPEGRYELQISFIGFTNRTLSLVLDKNLSQNISMDPDVSQLNEIVVTPSNSLTAIDMYQLHAESIDPDFILNKPFALGEADLIKSLDVIPGVQLFRDGSTFFNVRGGDRDQNQLLVDEAPIYNSAHLLGLFSSFMPEAIKDAKLYKGNAPAEYGGRVSSVLDIHTRDGNKYDFNLEGKAGLVSSRLSLEGPLKKGKSSFFLSGRRSHFGSILRGLGADFNELFFSDFAGKVNIGLNQKNRLFLSVFSSKDEYLNNGGLRWENKAGTIRWNNLITNRLFLNTTFYTSRYDYNLIAGENLVWKNHITNASLKTDFTFYKRPESTIKFGLKLSGHNFNPGNIEGNDGSTFDFVPKRNATELSLYVSHDRQIGNNWLMNYGLRLSTWTNFGRTIEYELDETYQVVDSMVLNTRDEYNGYANLEPRFNLTNVINSRNQLTFNYARSAQYINLISNSISPFNNLEVWMPASINIKPQLGNQLSLGWIHNHPKWNFQLEGYTKYLENQLDYIDQAQLLLNPHLEAELRSGESWAHGFEATLTKKSGKLTGWMAYAFSRSYRKIEGINNNDPYPTLWDRPHQFTTSLTYQPSKRNTFSGTLLISSGAPTSRPTSYFQYSGSTIPIYSEKNNSRLPTYHRFDVSWSHRINKKDQSFNHFLSVSIFNFYGQKNTILESFNKIETEDGTFKVPISATNEVLVPTYRFVYNIVPSITYSFRI